MRRRVSKKLIDFTGTKISDVKQINPLFSTCKVRVLYTGKNRNMSIISKDAVEKALPSMIGVPIVGEFSMENKDYKGHGGAIDLDSYDFIHTTKPYGFVPQDATFSWEEVKTRDGSIREYLTVDGCYLWTGRYPEAYSIIEQGKGQSMEIEVNEGTWSESDEAYDIKNFTFSALCILGDEVEPAFEDANITASFSLDSDVFKMEYAKMMQDVKSTLLEEKEDENEMLKDLLIKYSTTMEVLTAKGLNFSEISEEELEAKIAEALEVEVIVEAVQAEAEGEEAQAVASEEGAQAEEAQAVEGEQADEEGEEQADQSAEADQAEGELEGEQAQQEADEAGVDAQEDTQEQEEEEATQVDNSALEARIQELENELATAIEERDSLQEFKLNIEKVDHASKAQKLFSDFQLTEEDVKDLDVHQFSIEQIEEKCYAILGRKMASKKNFSLQSKEQSGIRLPLHGSDSQEQPTSPYGDLFDKYKN